MTLAEAIQKLDTQNDDHWTKTGLPSMDILEGMIGDSGITRKDVEQAAPGYKRPAVQLPHAMSSSKTNKRAEVDGEETKVVTTTDELVQAYEERRPVQAAVVAVRKGYYGGRIRNIGDKFTINAVPGSWMVCSDATGKEAVEEAQLVEQQGVQAGVTV